MNDNKQRIQCGKCWHFRSWHEGNKLGHCSLYDKVTLSTNSCNLKEKRKKESEEKKDEL